jgi:hypothetical protein
VDEIAIVEVSLLSSNAPILVLGAGELGMAVIRGLARQAVDFPGRTLTVLMRRSTISSDDPLKQRDVAELRSLGVKLLPGDLVAASVGELATQFQDFHTVIGCTGFVAGRNVQFKIARAALDAGVRRYIPWQFGVDYDLIGRGSAQDLFDEQLDVRDLLRSQDRTEWVIISTGMFTSFLFEPSFGVVDLDRNTLHALGSWDNAVTVTAPEDIGDLTAQIVSVEPRIVNRIVYTAGDTVTYQRLGDIVEAVQGRKLHRAVWSVPHLRNELGKAPNNSIKKYRVLFAEGKGVAWDFERTFNAQRGVEVLNVEQWARMNLNTRKRTTAVHI